MLTMLAQASPDDPAPLGTALVVVYAVAIAVVGAFGVASPWLVARHGDGRLVAYGNSFAGGVLLAAGLIHLLGDANEGFATAYPDVDYPAAYAIATAAFLLVLAVERVIPRASAAGDPAADPEAAALLAGGQGGGAAPYLLLLTLSIHSVIAGLTLGISSAAGAGVLLVAILAHKGAAGFALGSTFRESSIAPRTRIPALGIFVCSTPAGVLLGGLATAVLGGGDSAAEAWFKAVAAGTFLYIATLDVVREEFFPGGSDRASRLSFAMLGAGVMALVAIWM
ncbi:MAG: ZIP family metal transporter [Planctomycetota bacterium]|nr:ZIP family metal transporter [Planctomycetota bacterium]MEE2894690.1 ZIP family metal transporter [Planctomycetota bacterium]